MLAPHRNRYVRDILITVVFCAFCDLSCASRTTQQRISRLQGFQRYSLESIEAANAATSHRSSLSSSESNSNGLLQSTNSSFRRRALRQSLNCNYCAPNACVLSGTAGTFRCSVCLNGYKPNQSTGACECPAGYYPTGSGSSSSCVVCPLGSYCPGTVADSGVAGIYACPDGMTTIAAKSISQSSCVNAPGYFWVNSGAAQPCPTGTFSPGLRRQKTCNSCPSGYTTVQAGVATNYTACALSPGWYMTGPGSIARCPYGKYKEGYGSVSSCTSCPTGVTTDSAGKASAVECKYLLPGYEASNVSGTQILATAACRINAFCPGTTTPGDPGYVSCPNQRWTVNISSTSPLQCMVPPGHSANSTSVTKCPSGYYKVGWTLTDAADCMYCGNGIATEDSLEIKRYNQNGQPTASVLVAGASMSCYIPRGYEMVYTWNSASNAYSFTGRPCKSSGQVCAVGLLGDGNLYSNRCNGYGVNETVYGLRVRPCKLCKGPVSKYSGPDLGFSICSTCTSGLYSGASGFCEIPPGRATANASGSIFTTPPSDTTLIQSVVTCPANYYCLGGPSPTTVPTACPLMGSSAGATSSSGCNLITAGKAAADGSGTYFASPPSNISLIQSLVSCPANFYCPGGLATTTAPTACPLLGSLAGASSSTACNQIPPGQAAADSLGAVFASPPSNTSLIHSLVSCPANYYCLGGLATATAPTACSLLNSTAGASSSAGCNQVPAGMAAADSQGAVFTSAPSNVTLITSLVSCPANFYCPGGLATTTVPTACPLLGSSAGATSSSGCNLITAGKAAADGSGTYFASPPSNISLIQSLVSCPANFYCPGGLATTTAPTACPLLGSLAGASSSTACNQIPPGQAAADSLGAVFASPPSNISLIMSLVSCPANYYCLGGLATATAPTACGLLNSTAGASSSAGCNQIPAGKAAADSQGAVFTLAPPSSLSLIVSVVSCPANYYCPGGTATAVVPTVCPLLTSLAGASSSSACNLVPVGYAAANSTTVFSTTVSSISAITQLVACPQGFYCTGGDPTVIVPTPCNSYINTAGTGSTQLSDCNLAAPGYRLVSTNTPEECTSGYYTSGWTNASSCTACGNGLNWVSTQTYSVTVYIKSGNTRTAQAASTRGDLSICLGPPGYYYDPGTNALIACPDGTYKSTYDRATSCTSCGAGTSSSPRTSAGDCGVVGLTTGSSNYIYSSTGTLSAWNSNGASAGYSSVSLDQSGKYAVVARSTASVSGHVYFSSNAGGTWTQISTTSRTWVGVAINNAGNMVIAVSGDNAQVWQATTTNGGTNWTWSSITSSSGQGPWVTVAISGSGNKIIAAASASASSKKLWVGTSSDGVTYSWANGLSGGSALVSTGAWTGLAVADDGSYMAATQTSGDVYVSYDSGATFSVPSGSGYPTPTSCYSVACNKNCTQLLVSKSTLGGLLSGQVWKGVYSGGSWTWTQPLSTLLGNWREVASTSDGQTLVAGSQSVNILSVITLGSVWVSTNGGSSWSQATLNPSNLGLLQGDWTGIAVST